MNIMKALVLGGSYFVGRKLVEVLCQYDYDVTVLNRGTKEVPVPGVHQLICDRNDAAQMKEVLAGRSFDFVIDVSWKNLDWVIHTCDALDFTSVKQFVFLSSSAVYDVEHLTVPYHEEDPLAENQYWTFYGTGKIEAEHYYSEFLKKNGTNLIILRPPYIYGEYNYAQRESLIFRQIVDDKAVIIPKSNPLLQFIYTKDLAELIHRLLQSNDKPKCVYNVGNTIGVTSKEWVEACAKVVGKKALISECDYHSLGMQVRDFYPFFDYDNLLDVQKSKDMMPEETDFLVGLQNAYRWFLKNREQIQFKANVDQNLYEIIASLSI